MSLSLILITKSNVTFVATGYYDTDPKKKEKKGDNCYC